MRAVNLAALLTESGAHARAQPARPAGAALGHETDVEPQAGVDVVQAQEREHAEAGEVAERQERPVEPDALLGAWRRLVRPRENVAAPGEEDQRQEDEGDREERDVRLEEADHGP